jgi:hypothetical protein
VEPALECHVGPDGGVIEPGATAPSGDAAGPEGDVADGLTAGAPDDAPLVVGAGPELVGAGAVSRPGVVEDAQPDSASTAPRPSETATRCVVRGERTRGTG